MGMKVRVTKGGFKAITAEKRAAGRGLRKGAEHLLGASRQRVPLEEGTLERSGTATVDEGASEAAVAYDTPYAAVQHEALDYRHDAGRTAKYLEEPAIEEGPAIAAIIAAELKRGLS